MPKKSIPKKYEKYWKLLNNVIDPELHIGIIDLGLIYDVRIKKDKTAVVTMTLTTPTCPEGPLIIGEVEAKMLAQKEIKNVYVEIVWDPPWTADMMDPKIRSLLLGD